jgi:uncharacterized membrane protein
MTDAAQPPAVEAAQRDAGMSQVVHRNIAALMEVRALEERRRNLSDRIADTVTAFAGSMWCVYVHAIWFGLWIVINRGWIRVIEPFDPFPFVMLAMVASVEAIFLSTFILITQNRMQRMADRRAELDLQISLLTEHELTRAVRLIDQIARHLGIAPPAEQELDEIKQDVDPRRVVKEIERAEEQVAACKESA